MTQRLPKWATPERQSHLVGLFQRDGNRCLQGHPVCPNPAHYLYRKPKVKRVAGRVQMVVSESEQVKCEDRNGNYLRDREGNLIYVTRYKYKSAVTYEVTFTRLYDVVSEDVITDWKAGDRAEDTYAWRQERRRLHATPDEPAGGGRRGRFDSVARENFLLNRPDYYLEGVGYDPLVGQPVARLRIAGTNVRLFVHLPHGVVKLRMGKRWTVVHHYCNLAARDWKKQKRMM